MKKTISVLSILGLFLLIGNAATAQINGMKLVNNSNCPVTAQVTANNSNCRPECVSAVVTVPANSSGDIKLNCVSFDPGVTLQMQIMDNQSTATVGNGCGLPTSAPYLDCFGNLRNLIFLSTTTAVIN